LKMFDRLRELDHISTVRATHCRPPSTALLSTRQMSFYSGQSPE
jgi:hypothetical protein